MPGKILEFPEPRRASGSKVIVSNDDIHPDSGEVVPWRVTVQSSTKESVEYEKATAELPSKRRNSLLEPSQPMKSGRAERASRHDGSEIIRSLYIHPGVPMPRRDGSSLHNIPEV